MTRNHRLPAIAALPLLLGFAFAGLAPVSSASPCIPGCGWVTADPFVSSSTAEGESTLTSVQWEHCLYTMEPSQTKCNTGSGPAFVSTLRADPAACAKGVLRANGQVVAETLWIC